MSSDWLALQLPANQKTGKNLLLNNTDFNMDFL